MGNVPGTLRLSQWFKFGVHPISRMGRAIYAVDGRRSVDVKIVYVDMGCIQSAACNFRVWVHRRSCVLQINSCQATRYKHIIMLKNNIKIVNKITINSLHLKLCQ